MQSTSAAVSAASASQRLFVWLKAAIAFGAAGLLWLIMILRDAFSSRAEVMDDLLIRRSHLLSQTSSGDWMTPTAKFLSLIGNWQFIAPIGVLVLLLAWRRRISWRDFFLYIAAVAGTSALTLLFKYGVNRPRQEIVPALEKAPFASFPSGHTVFALVIYGYLAHLILSHIDSPPRWLRWLLYGIAALIAGLVGIARVYLATHYPTDVIGGLLIGIPWLLAVIALHNHFTRHQREALKTASNA